MFSNLPPLHPALVHFPIAFLLLAGVAGVLSLFLKREFWKDLTAKFLIIGVIFFPLVVITGLIEEQNLEHNEAVHEMLLTHKYIGLSLLFYYQILLLWYWLRKKITGNKEYIGWVLCLFIGSLLMSYQGFLGSEMVFKYGAGVKSIDAEMKSSDGHDHGGVKMEMNDSSGTNDEHDMNASHHDTSMKDMKGMDMNGMENKEMKGMDMNNIKDMKKMDDMKGMDNMKGMKDMKGMNKKDMKGMDMNNMKDMKGMDNKKDMKGMENMKDMKGMDNMDNMKDMNMPGMDMKMNPMDTFRFKDNNPARRKPTEKKQ